MIGAKVIGTVAKVATNKNAMRVVDVLFYTSSAIKAVTGLCQDLNRDYEIRCSTDRKVDAIVRDEVHDYLVDNRQDLLKRVLTEDEKNFLISVAEGTAKKAKRA